MKNKYGIFYVYLIKLLQQWNPLIPIALPNAAKQILKFAPACSEIASEANADQTIKNFPLCETKDSGLSAVRHATFDCQTGIIQKAFEKATYKYQQVRLTKSQKWK